MIDLEYRIYMRLNLKTLNYYTLENDLFTLRFKGKKATGRFKLLGGFKYSIPSNKQLDGVIRIVIEVQGETLILEYMNNKFFNRGKISEVLLSRFKGAKEGSVFNYANRVREKLTVGQLKRLLDGKVIEVFKHIEHGRG